MSAFTHIYQNTEINTLLATSLTCKLQLARETIQFNNIKQSSPDLQVYTPRTEKTMTL